MNQLKRIITFTLICLTITTVIPTQFNDMTLTVEAHSGRTDKYGGHKDNKNVSGLGSYHYHCGGYPAHLHTNGICPYANSAVGSSIVAPATTSTVKAAETTMDTNSNSAIQSNINNTVQQAPVASSTQVTVPATVTISDTSYDNAAFNASYYATNHVDIYETCGDSAKALYEHFITSGIYEGRQASAQFNILVYKANNQDLKDAFGDDLIKYYNHYLEYGVNESRVCK